MNKIYEHISNIRFFVNFAILPDMVASDATGGPGVRPGSPEVARQRGA